MRLRWILSRPSKAQVVLALAIVLAIAAVLHAPALGDVEVYRAGGRAVLHDGDLYGFRQGDHQHGFTYPPFAALLFAGVAWLPAVVVWVAMAIGSSVALFVVVRLSAPDLIARLTRAEVPAAIALGLLVLTQPVIATFRWGQVNLLLAALVMLDVLVLRRGVLVGIATAVKLTPGLFVVFLLLRARRREAAGAVGAFAATVALGWCVLPSASKQYWTHVVISGDGIGGFDRPGNESIRGLAERLFGVGPGTVVWLALVPPVLACGLALARRLTTDAQEIAAVGVVGVTACLVSPMSWTHHWVWVVPVLAGCLRARRVPATVRNAGFAVAVVWTFTSPARVEPSWLAAIDTAYVPVALAAGLAATATVFAVSSRCLHSPGASARLDLALVYGECQPVNGEVRPAHRPSRALSTGSRTDISE